MSGDVAIELDKVTVRRDGRPVLDAVSLAVRAGSIHVVMGPNGSGKSTLLTAILGQISFTGAIKLHLRGEGRIGYVPQSFVADRTLPITIAELLALERQRWPVCLGVRPATRTRIDAILERVGLAGMAARRLGELSGGELRRVLIGNAIEPEPELLLCDEPATGLDTESLAQLDAELIRLRDKHATTIVMVSHDRAQIRRVADRVTTVAPAGLRSGSPGELLRDEAAR